MDHHAENGLVTGDKNRSGTLDKPCPNIDGHSGRRYLVFIGLAFQMENAGMSGKQPRGDHEQYEEQEEESDHEVDDEFPDVIYHEDQDHVPPGPLIHNEREPNRPYPPDPKTVV